ncbi:putative adenylate cyclase [Danaus plexippus plexippus]|uniref:Adenylate cyclase n=1 Tax=Danaus plexippus plexippus TaxID=278856 RepID=A0A212EU91_DANPL|nr:putative adenylate cyclase [Danaus plexippus plexippus]
MVLIKEEEPLKEEKKIENKKTLRENIAYIRENITLEPVLITFVIPGVLARLATQNLNLDKACRVNLQFGEKICDALIAKTGSNYHNEELKIQELIASMEVKKVGFLKSFFDIKHVKDTFAVAFKKGPNNRRMKSILVLACVVFIYGPAYGEHTVRYLFGRYRFNWDIVKYSFYNTFYICLHLLGATISITFLSKKLKWQDATLGILSNVSKIIGCIATGLSRTTLEIYVAVVLEMFNATPFTALRSISSKLATSDELGKMTAIFNLTEVVTSMVFGPTFSWIYMVTLKYESGFIYYLSAVVTVPSLMIFIWFYRQHKIVEKEQKTESVNIENGHENDKQQKNQSLVNSAEPNVSSL